MDKTLYFGTYKIGDETILKFSDKVTLKYAITGFLVAYNPKDMLDKIKKVASEEKGITQIELEIETGHKILQVKGARR